MSGMERTARALNKVSTDWLDLMGGLYYRLWPHPSNTFIKFEMIVVGVFVRSSKDAGAITLRLVGLDLRASQILQVGF